MTLISRLVAVSVFAVLIAAAAAEKAVGQTQSIYRCKPLKSISN